MNLPSRPTGYDVAYHVSSGRPICHITVGFDLEEGHVPRFLVYLHYRTSTNPVEWTAIARMDHNETPGQGHDVYLEGLHVDVAHRSERLIHLKVPHSPLPSNRGIVVRGCERYLRHEADYFIRVYEGHNPPGSPPRWSPNGGESAGTFIRANQLEEDMSREAPAEDEVLTPEELSEVLAEATGTTVEEIELGVGEVEIAPPWEGEIVGLGDVGPLTEPDDE